MARRGFGGPQRSESDRAQSFRSSAETAQERLGPLIPNLVVGLGGGGLGGGRGSDFDNFGGTGDLTVGVVWGLDNLGLGNRATTRRRKAQSKQAQVALARVRDRIAGEVAIAYQEVHDGRRQIEFAAENVEQAQRSLELNMARIRAAEGLPIEALQAVSAAADAREAFLEATLDYNRAQLRLLRAVRLVRYRRSSHSWLPSPGSSHREPMTCPPRRFGFTQLWLRG